MNDRDEDDLSQRMDNTYIVPYNTKIKISTGEIIDIRH